MNAKRADGPSLGRERIRQVSTPLAITAGLAPAEIGHPLSDVKSHQVMLLMMAG
jgi:hypothetical protein